MSNVVNGIIGATVNAVGALNGSVGIGKYIVNDYVLTLEPLPTNDGYTLTIQKGSDVQTVTLEGLSEENMETFRGYVAAAQAAQLAAEGAQSAAETAQGNAEDAQTAAEAAQSLAETAQAAAETAETNAGASATQAGTSASSAAQSATQAAGSAAAAAQTLTDVQAAGQAQIAAIGAEGERVLETIPEDYTEMSGDVSNLKTSIEDVPDIKDSTKTGVDLDISDPSGNVIFRLADGHIQTKNFNSAEKQVDATILTVKSSGGDYTGIRAAVEAAATAGASAENPYIIQIDPGTYDILSEYTSEEIATSGFVGLMITNGITLEGMGMLRDDTVLYAEMDTTVYDTTKRNDVSTLNFRGNVGLKNLTVKSKNMRYGIHDDFSYSSDKPKIRRLENCIIYAEATTSWNIGNVSYGAGTDGNKIFIFDDCDLGDTVLIHTDVGQYSNMVIMHHCRCFQFIAKDYASTAVNRYYLYGCDFKWIRQNHVGDTWTSQHLFMLGDIKGAYVEGYAGMQYELGDSYRVQQSPVTTYPRAVTSATTGRYHIQTTSNADAVTGVLYYYDSTEGYALVQTGGWICAELLGFETPTVGQYLVVGSSGALSLESSDTNAIGRVVFENENSKHFIKLNI